MTATYKILPVPAGSVTVLCYYYIKLVRHCVNWRGHVRSCPGKKDALPIYSPGNITLVKIPLRALGIKSPIRTLGVKWDFLFCPSKTCAFSNFIHFNILAIGVKKKLEAIN